MKTPASEPLFNIAADLRLAALLKKRLRHSCFTADFVKFLSTPFFTELLQWLLLVQVTCHVIISKFSYFSLLLQKILWFFFNKLIPVCLVLPIYFRFQQ